MHHALYQQCRRTTSIVNANTIRRHHARACAEKREGGVHRTRIAITIVGKKIKGSSAISRRSITWLAVHSRPPSARNPGSDGGVLVSQYASEDYRVLEDALRRCRVSWTETFVKHVTADLPASSTRFQHPHTSDSALGYLSPAQYEDRRRTAREQVQHLHVREQAIRSPRRRPLARSAAR